MAGARYRLSILTERSMRSLFFLCAAVSVATTACVLWVLISQSILFFEQVAPWRYILDTQWTPLFADQHFGIWPLITGTILTSCIAIAVALPFGLLAAIYMSEFASLRSRKIVKPLLELLAGLPTVVYGYFALAEVTPLLQRIVPNLSGFNALSPGIVMGIMIVPMISSLSEDAIFAVPHQLREAAYGLGARRLPTIFRIVIPSAFSGIAAAVALAIGRAIGETMIVTIAAGQRPTLTLDPRVPVETMTAYIVQVSMGDTPSGTLEHHSIFVVGATLFALTFAVHSMSQRLARRFHGAGK